MKRRTLTLAAAGDAIGGHTIARATLICPTTAS